MSPHEPSPHDLSSDDDLRSQLGAVAVALDHPSEPLEGAIIRTSGAPVISHGRSRARRRTLFLSAAAAVVAVAGLATALAVNGRGSSDTTTVVGPATEARSNDSVDDETSSNTAPGEEVDQVQPAEETATPSTVAPLENRMPIRVEAAELGPVEARYLPPVDAGLTVIDASQILTSEAGLEPPTAEPVRVQSLVMLTADPSDRRVVTMMASSYATDAEADAVLADELTAMGHEGGEPVELAGLAGNWVEQEATAPLSGGEPVHMLAFARVRLDATTVFDVGGPDITLEQVEAVVAAAVLADDGSLTVPVELDGFEAPMINTSGGLYEATIAGGAVDHLEYLLVDDSGRQLPVAVLAGRSDAFDRSGAILETEVGFGLVAYGLFRELTATWVTDDAAIRLTDYSGTSSAEELLALAQLFEPVDEAEWTERLAASNTWHTPVLEE